MKKRILEEISSKLPLSPDLADPQHPVQKDKTTTCGLGPAFLQLQGVSSPFLHTQEFGRTFGNFTLTG